MKTYLKLLTCLTLMACSSTVYASEVCDGSIQIQKIEAGRGNCCKNIARELAIEINNEIDQAFPLSVPATAEEGAALFASFFAEDGVFQSPGGILRGRDAIFAGILAYGQNPGEMDQHVITRKAYWDAEKATLTVERTWFATLTAPRDFCGTILPTGATYSQDDCVVVRFDCCRDCETGCVLPGDVVYYREYFDFNEFESNFTSDYPPACHEIGAL